MIKPLPMVRWKIITLRATYLIAAASIVILLWQIVMDPDSTLLIDSSGFGKVTPASAVLKRDFSQMSEVLLGAFAVALLFFSFRTYPWAKIICILFGASWMLHVVASLAMPVHPKAALALLPYATVLLVTAIVHYIVDPRLNGSYPRLVEVKSRG